MQYSFPTCMYATGPDFDQLQAAWEANCPPGTIIIHNNIKYLVPVQSEVHHLDGMIIQCNNGNIMHWIGLF